MNGFWPRRILLFLAMALAPSVVGWQVPTVNAQEEVIVKRPIPGPVVPPPFFRAALERGTRSPDGSPGPNYWQVYSEYDIDARLDPVSGLLSGPRRSGSTTDPRWISRRWPSFFTRTSMPREWPGVGPTEITGGVRLEQGEGREGRTFCRSRASGAPGYLRTGGS